MRPEPSRKQGGAGVAKEQEGCKGGGSGEKLLDTADAPGRNGGADQAPLTGSLMPLAGDPLGKAPATAAMMPGGAPPPLGAPGMIPPFVTSLGQQLQQRADTTTTS